MTLSKCEYCEKPFNSIGSKLCAECAKLMDDAYVKVRKYIYQNAETANYSSIVENTEIPEQVLNYLLTQGRIVLGDMAGKGTKCRACGAETVSGSLCERCKGRLISEHLLSPASKADKPERKSAGQRTQPLSYNQKGS